MTPTQPNGTCLLPSKAGYDLYCQQHDGFSAIIMLHAEQLDASSTMIEARGLFDWRICCFHGYHAVYHPTCNPKGQDVLMADTPKARQCVNAMYAAAFPAFS